MGAILVSPRRLKSLENEVEDLMYDLRTAEEELREVERAWVDADRALIEMWSFVPKDKRRELIESNEYIGEMFWNDRDM